MSFPFRAFTCLRNVGCSWGRRASSVALFPRIASARPVETSFKQQSLSERLSEALKLSREGGGPAAVHRHTQVNKKLLPRERLRFLLDKDESESFVELSPLAGLSLEYGNVPCGGLIVGLGQVAGITCLVIVSETTVKGGSTYPITLTKQLRAQEIALQNRLPVVYIIDSAGAFLPLQSEIFVPGGKTFYNQAVHSSHGLQQVTVVCGHCTAGAAYIPSMAEEAVIVRGMGGVFLGGPPLVKAATGEIVSADDLGGADVHCRLSGGTDHYATNEQEAFEMTRCLVAAFGKTSFSPAADVEEPLYSCDDMWSLLPHPESRQLDMHQILARLLDGSRLQPFKSMFGATIITGYARLGGSLIGVVANDGPMTVDGAVKVSHFVQNCSQRQLPLLFLQHTVPVETGNQAALIRAVGRMMSTVACASVPKITLIVGDSCGAVGSAMGGLGMKSNFIFSLPSARRAHLGAEQVIKELNDDITESLSLSQEEMFSRLADKASAFYWSARLLDDGIIAPPDTRKVLSRCLNAALENRQPALPNYGVIRM